jgi:hypothetical protein
MAFFSRDEVNGISFSTFITPNERLRRSVPCRCTRLRWDILYHPEAQCASVQHTPEEAWKGPTIVSDMNRFRKHEPASLPSRHLTSIILHTSTGDGRARRIGARCFSSSGPPPDCTFLHLLHVLHERESPIGEQSAFGPGACPLPSEPGAGHTKHVLEIITVQVAPVTGLWYRVPITTVPYAPLYASSNDSTPKLTSPLSWPLLGLPVARIPTGGCLTASDMTRTVVCTPPHPQLAHWAGFRCTTDVDQPRGDFPHSSWPVSWTTSPVVHLVLHMSRSGWSCLKRASWRRHPVR